jgi:hypothetical protein
MLAVKLRNLVAANSKRWARISTPQPRIATLPPRQSENKRGRSRHQCNPLFRKQFVTLPQTFSLQTRFRSRVWNQAIENWTTSVAVERTWFGIRPAQVRFPLVSPSANTFGAGLKQTFTANGTLAGLNVAGVVTDPSAPVSGDLWFNTTTGRLNFRNGSVHSLAFLDDVSNIQNGQLAHSSITINTAAGSGLSGGGSVALGNALSLSIPAGGVTNGMLQNSSIGVTAGSGIAVAGTTSLGGSFSITNIGVLSFNTRTGPVMPMTGDYSFAQLSGTASKNQLPGAVVYATSPTHLALV